MSNERVRNILPSYAKLSLIGLHETPDSIGEMERQDVGSESEKQQAQVPNPGHWLQLQASLPNAPLPLGARE
jgi:hypothetical protein